jgi:WD40 repeat protein
MDRKMGRTTNCCATKYLRKVVGVKYRKNELRYRERAAVIKAVIATTATPTIEKVFRLLTDFVQSGSLPPGCSELYNAILETSPLDTTPEPSQKPDAVSVSISSVSVRVRERLRPGARTSEGDMNLKAMTRRFRETPDVLSDEASVFSDNVYDSSSDIEIHTLARKEYPEDSFVRRKKPYLGLNERRTLKSSLKNVDWEDDNWGGQSIHLDPEEDELAMLRQCANAVITSKDGVSISLQSAAKNASQAQIADIARRAKLLPQFRDRTRKSIQAMLTDAATGNLSRTPMRFRITPPLSPPSEKRISTRLLRRELGGAKTASRSIYQTVYDSLAPSRSWTGASGDVGTVAWSPDGRHFAAGSMCLVDPSSMQYNRPNNLLFGNTQHQTLYELPEHHRPREKPDEGANSSHSMHVSQDPRLFFTVSMVDFSRDGSHMFSVGYDNFLRSYEVGSSRCDQNWVVDYGAEVDVLATSRHLDLLATGSHDIESGIRIYGTHGQNKLLTTVGSSKARNFLDKKIYPSAVRWGIHNSVKNYLLAGFSPTAGDETNTTHGETCLWDVARQTPIAVNPSAGNIFDVAWSPRSARFATACTAYGQSVNKGTHSLVRICSPVDMDRWSNGCLELECPARDINDVILCPYDENYVAAGATNNEIYIWDIRRPNSLLQRFAHGEPLAELDPGMSQELADCGVRFCSWGENRERLHTGSSDGVVKVWDIFRSPQDSHIRDIASFNSGVMSGAFNHDFSSLLIGEVNGTINLLEVGADPPDLLKDLDTFHFEPAVAETHIDAGTPVINKESGIWIGKRARKARKIKFRPMAGFPRRQATQGMNYDGPYDSAPDAEQLRDAAALFQKKLKVEKDSQCENPLCKEYVGVTEEEAGDSGRAVDRIPEALRDAATSGMVGNEAKEGKMVPGMLRCSHCGGLARPRISDKEQEKSPLCERCGFSCFRCGGRVKVGLAVEKVGCARCELEWRIGALGYEVIRSSGCGKTSKKVPPVLQLDPFQHDVLSLRKEGKAEKSGLEDMGDLLYLVEDYYHGLWEDSPSSAL